ncbi:MAG: Fic family protein [Acidimicrobiales bacterium]
MEGALEDRHPLGHLLHGAHRHHEQVGEGGGVVVAGPVGEGGEGGERGVSHQSHPWITFRLNHLTRLEDKTWMLFGEARSKCEHLAGTPLKPAIAEDLYTVALVKGVRGTTAIEGNTLTEEQVRGIVDGTFRAPPSREYQEQEVRNVLDALDRLNDLVSSGKTPELSRELICDLNDQLLEGTELEEGVVPGRIREGSVGVGPYRGAPAEDCPYLVDRLCEWLEGPDFRSDDPEIGFARTLIAAIVAHLYIAWIHPFDDGNGRTARLIEFLILGRSGRLPLPAAHLLSNHYNLTRDRYYRELDAASRSGGEIRRIVTYAVEGFVDGIREHIDLVRVQQFQVAWVNYVHEIMGRYPNTKACDRQRSLVLAMAADNPVRKSELPNVSTKVARLYADAGPRTLSRDVNRLLNADLVERTPRGFLPNVGLMAAFMPPTPDPPAAQP